MAAVVLRRSLRGTLSAVLNFALTLAAGVVVLGNQWVAAAPSGAWVAVGLALVLWAGLILSALMRPVMLVVDEAGLAFRGLLGTTRFAWDDLLWADFDGGGRSVMVAAQVAGRARLAAVARKPVDPGDLAQARAAVLARRPDLPMTRPGAAGGPT